MTFFEFKEHNTTNLSVTDANYVNMAIRHILMNDIDIKVPMPYMVFLINIEKHIWDSIVKLAEKYKKNAAFL